MTARDAKLARDNCSYYYTDSEAGFWNSGKEGTPDRPNQRLKG